MNVFIIGAQASGKMTVGQELAKLTGAKLFHNHQSIDFTLELMDEFSPEMMELNSYIVFGVLRTFARLNRPIISTGLVDFNVPEQVEFLEIIQDIFHQYQREILFVELDTSLEERLRRNRTENRLKHKPLKRNILVSERDILATASRCHYTAATSPASLKHYYKLNNTELSAHESAQLILQKLKDIENI